MTRFFLAVAVAALAMGLTGGCASKKPKSSAHLYEGDAPTITYSDRPEAAGGAINPY